MTMRTPLLIAALGLVSALPSPDAEACGSYGPPVPQVMVVSNHVARTANVESRPRSFVVLDAAATGKLRWRPIALHSYDSTEIAAAGPLGDPLELTLVGPSSSRTVTVSRRVALKRNWRFHEPRLAAEIDDPRQTMMFAIEGSEPVTWLNLETTDESGTVQRVAGTDATATITSTEGGPATVVRVGGFQVRQVAGYTVGAIGWGGQQFVLVEHAGQITPVRI